VCTKVDQYLFFTMCPFLSNFLMGVIELFNPAPLYGQVVLSIKIFNDVIFSRPELPIP
jgi:hypothetical protein